MISVHFQGKPFNITVIQVHAPTSNAEEAEVKWFYEDLQDLLELTGIWNEAGQRLIELCQTPSSNNTREDSTYGHHQVVNTEIRLIIFFAAEDGEALYSQQKQDQELTVAQTMNSLLPNSDLI